MHAHVSSKFNQRAETVTAKFLFSKWILKAFCSDANKNGLVSSVAIQGVLQRNLYLIQDALTALVSSEEDFSMIIRELPHPMNEMCESRRGQATRFMQNLVETRVEDKTLEEESLDSIDNIYNENQKLT